MAVPRAPVPSQLLYEQLRHMDIRHFVILECRHLANGCVLKCGCIGLMLFCNLSIMSGHNNMLYKYYRNCSGICMQRLQVMQPLANVHEIKWTPHVKWESDVAVHIIAVVPCTSSNNKYQAAIPASRHCCWVWSILRPKWWLDTLSVAGYRLCNKGTRCGAVVRCVSNKMIATTLKQFACWISVRASIIWQIVCILVSGEIA